MCVVLNFGDPLDFGLLTFVFFRSKINTSMSKVDAKSESQKPNAGAKLYVSMYN